MLQEIADVEKNKADMAASNARTIEQEVTRWQLKARRFCLFAGHLALSVFRFLLDVLQHG